MDTPRDMLMDGAQIVEVETRGYLPASGFTKIIDKGLLNHAAGDELEGFFPINVALDQNEQPTEAPSTAAKFATGAIALYSDRAVLGWMKGLIRIKVGSFRLDRASIVRVDGIELGGADGIDVALADGRVITLLFGTALDRRLVGEWRRELGGALKGSTGEAPTPPA